MSPTRQANAPAHAARYEELRQHAVEREILVGRLGLVVLLQQGLASWVEQWSKMPAPIAAPSVEISRAPPLTNDTSGDVINLLAAMALGHVQEIHT